MGNLQLVRYVTWTLADALRAFGLQSTKGPSSELLAMLVEETVHRGRMARGSFNQFGAFGITIRGRGLDPISRRYHGFWRQFLAHYRALGGVLPGVGCAVERIDGRVGAYRLATPRNCRGRSSGSAAPSRPAWAAQLGPPGADKAREAVFAVATPACCKVAPLLSSSASPTARWPAKTARIINSCTTIAGHWDSETICSFRSRRRRTQKHSLATDR